MSISDFLFQFFFENSVSVQCKPYCSSVNRIALNWCKLLFNALTLALNRTLHLLVFCHCIKIIISLEWKNRTKIVLEDTFGICIYTDCNDFLKIYISQGSVATQLRCDGIFNNRFVTNCVQRVTVKEFFLIGKYLANILTKVKWNVFCGRRCTVSPRFAANHSRVEYAWSGSQRNISCRSSGVPTPKIDWLIDNIVLRNNGTYHVYELGAASHLQVCLWQ